MKLLISWGFHTQLYLEVLFRMEPKKRWGEKKVKEEKWRQGKERGSRRRKGVKRKGCNEEGGGLQT